MNTEKIKEILRLDENIIINDIKLKEKEVNIYIKLEKKDQTCPCCKNKVNRIHDYYMQKLKDLHMFDKDTLIILKKEDINVNVERYFCKKITL